MERLPTVQINNTNMVIPKNADPKLFLLTQYHDYLDVFNRKQANLLPPHRPWDHLIDLQPGTTPPASRPYSMNQKELKFLREHLDQELSKGFIRLSCSPAAAPVLFVKKPNGYLRFFIDYRGLNAISVKNRHALPLISETLSQLTRAKPGKQGGKPDAFTRIGSHRPLNLEDDRIQHQYETLFKPTQIIRCLDTSSDAASDPESLLLDDREKHCTEDKYCQDIRLKLETPDAPRSDKVYLSLKGIDLSRPSKKSDNVRAGPWKIIRMKTTLVAKLDLPFQLKIDNNFHISLLRPAFVGFSSQHQDQPPPLEPAVYGPDTYEVETILDSRVRRNKVQSQVRWTGDDIT
ncbi:hypothetical protein K3495_g2421 [Podosphaera aphanis]|nr:hypothetical protein K3495_g2421 [Podosphaera aphanis]